MLKIQKILKNLKIGWQWAKLVLKAKKKAKVIIWIYFCLHLVSDDNI